MSEETATVDGERCPSTAPSDPTARCVRPVGHDGHHQPRAQLANGCVRWSDSTDSDVIEPPATFCGQRDPLYPDDGCCTLEPGHPRWQDDGDGDVWDHARLDANGEMITGWNVPVEPLRQREPGSAFTAERPGWHEFFGPQLTADLPGLMFAAAQRVRVRFVDLPHRNVPREVAGIMAHTIEPGGFALVVDRFNGMARLDSEREFWEAFGVKIGAATVLLYPGDLEVVGWLDNE